MEIREVPEASPKCKSSSQRSHSSSSRGSIKGARGSKKVDKCCLGESCDEQRLPVHGVPVSPERPPRAFLKTSFGQRLGAQCGSIFLDNTTSNFQHLQRQESRVPAAVTSQLGGVVGGSSSASEKNLRVNGNNSASGRGSSGLSEVDVKGSNNMVNAVAEVPIFRPAASNSQALKLWGFPPGALPKQRAIAMVGQGLQAAGKTNINRQLDPSSSRRDGSPLGHVERAACSSQGVAVIEGSSRDGIGVVPKVEIEEHAGSLELLEARRELIASASGRQVQKNLLAPPASTSHFQQQQQQIKSEGDCGGIELNDGGFNNRCSTDLPPLSVAADSEAPTANLSELGIGVAPNITTATTTTTNTTKRSSFKNDCGFLKLLPSKRKFSVEDQDQASPSPPQKPGYVISAGNRNNNNNAACCMVESESHMMNAGLRLSSNSSSGNNVIGRKSLLVHFSEKPKSADVNTRDRRTSCSSEQLNSSNGGKQPMVGSFMKWMIDVGKGIAKKRCFGNGEAPPAQASTPQSIAQVVSPLGSSPVTCLDQALHISKVASRPASPQSCQNMDCSEDQNAAMLLNAKSSTSPPEDGGNGSEMHISGDELAQQQQQQQHQEEEDAGHGADAHESDDDDDDLKKQKLGLPQDAINDPQHPAEASNEGEGGHSQNATQGTQGTTRSGERQKSATTTRQKKTISRKDEKQEQEEQEQSKVKQERALDLQQEYSENIKSGGEASFGMWQASSCLLGSQERKGGATDVSGSKRQLQQQNINIKNSRNNLPSYPPKDGSGDGECSQGMAEFVASMATVKSWVYNSFKCRETERSSNMSLHGGGGVSSSSCLNRPCSFCGLRGHAVADCSETLECELKELERRASVLEDMSTEIRDLPCLRCLGMGHLGAQCRFSVTEAASRARENSELRNWRFTRRSGSTNDGPLWTQNSNMMAAAHNSANSAAEVMIDRKAKQQSPSDSHKQQQHSSRERSKHEENPKEHTHPYKKIGLNNQQQQQQQQQQHKESSSKPATPCKKKPVPQNEASPPPVPKGMLAAVESVRLSRSELWRWVDSPDFNTHVRGFFLRLRFGRWEKDLGGTGYRMARIRGAIRKLGADDKNMSVSVDLGDMECTVDSQYVSNHPFTEAELVEWWRGRWKAGKRLITEAELQTKLVRRRQKW